MTTTYFLWNQDVSRKISEYFSSCHDSCKILMQIDEGHPLNLFCRVENAIRTPSVKCCCGIRDKVGVKTEIACHASRGLDAMIGGESCDDERCDVVSSETLFQICPNECA